MMHDIADLQNPSRSCGYLSSSLELADKSNPLRKRKQYPLTVPKPPPRPMTEDEGAASLMRAAREESSMGGGEGGMVFSVLAVSGKGRNW
jgi:hypothetical protein